MEEKNTNSTTSIAFRRLLLCAYKDGAKIWARKRMIFWSGNQICGTILIQIIWIHTHTQWVWIHLLLLSLWCVSRCHHFFLWSSLPRRFYTHTQRGKQAHTLCTNNRVNSLNMMLSVRSVFVLSCYVIFPLLHPSAAAAAAASFICILWSRNSKIRNDAQKQLFSQLVFDFFSVNRTRIRFFSSSSSYSFSSFLFFLKTSNTFCFVSCKIYQHMHYTHTFTKHSIEVTFNTVDVSVFWHIEEMKKKWKKSANTRHHDQIKYNS